jgi:hypothetical protein
MGGGLLKVVLYVFQHAKELYLSGYPRQQRVRYAIRGIMKLMNDP